MRANPAAETQVIHHAYQAHKEGEAGTSYILQQTLQDLLNGGCGTGVVLVRLLLLLFVFWVFLWQGVSI